LILLRLFNNFLVKIVIANIGYLKFFDIFPNSLQLQRIIIPV
jgi:hypothetical protein